MGAWGEVEADRTGGMEGEGREGSLREENEEAAGGRSQLENAEGFRATVVVGLALFLR